MEDGIKIWQADCVIKDQQSILEYSIQRIAFYRWLQVKLNLYNNNWWTNFCPKARDKIYDTNIKLGESVSGIAWNINSTFR